jgi:hypothetical protein
MTRILYLLFIWLIHRGAYLEGQGTSDNALNLVFSLD